MRGGEIVTTIAPLFLTVIGIIGTFATFLLEHPKEKYQEDIPEIKNNRLGDVCNTLAPIVSDSYDFARDDDDSAHDELSSENRASVAVTNAITPPDDLPPLEEALDDFRRPEIVYGRCRKSYFASYALFISGIVLGVIPSAVGRVPGISNPLLVGIIPLFISVLSVAIGVVLLAYFIILNQKLDTMSDSATFSLD